MQLKFYAIYTFSLLFVLLHCLFFIDLTCAAEEIYHKGSFDISKIRTPGTSYSILEDKDGFLWIGTDIGLWRYNGYDFEDFTNIIPERIDGQIFQDHIGDIWVGTHSRLVQLNPVTLKSNTYKFDSADRESISSHIFQGKKQAFAEDSLDNLWIATNDGLNIFSRDSKTFSALNTQNSGLLDNFITGIVVSKEGFLWVATRESIHILDPSRRHVIQTYSNAPEDISFLCEDNNGTLWIGTRLNGLFKIEKESKTIRKYNDTDHLSNYLSVTYLNIFSDTPNYLWITTIENGLCIIDVNSESFMRLSLNIKDGNNHAFHDTQQEQIINDKMGALFLLSSHGILYRLEHKHHNFVQYPIFEQNSDYGTYDSCCNACLDYDRTMWLLIVSEHKLYHYSPSFDSFLDIYSLDKNIEFSNESSLILDKSGMLWLSAKDTLIKFDPHKGKITERINVDGYLWNGKCDISDPNLLWFGTKDNGLIKIDINTHDITTYTPEANNPLSIGSNQVLVLAQTYNRNIWLSAFGVGLQCFDPVKGYVVDKHTLGLNRGDPVKMFQDSQNRYWVTFQNSGPGLFYPDTRKFLEFKEITGKNWPLRGSTGVIEDRQGVFWISGNASGEIVRFDPDTNSLKTYKTIDGIRGGTSLPWQNNSIVDSQGAVWFAGIGGFTRFFPNQIEDNRYRPPVFITKITQDNIPIDTKGNINYLDELILPPDKNYFEFEAAALNYRRPSLNNYKYRLAGWDEHWNAIGNKRTGQYSNLKEGMYILEVYGSNDDNVWSAEPAKLNIYVEPDLPEDARLFSLETIMDQGRMFIDYDNNSIIFEICPKDYSIVDNDIYKYKLEGYDKDWIYVTNSRYSLYKKIPDGHFSFNVVNTRSGESYSLPLTVRPPFYRSFGFFVLLVVILSSILGLFYKQRIKFIKIEQEEEIKLQKEKLRHINLEMNLEKERLKALEAHKKSEAQFKELITSMTEGFCIMDNAGNLIFANDRFSNLLGLNTNEIRNNNVFDFMDAENSNKFKQFLLNNKSDQLDTFEIKWHDGNNGIIDSLVSPKQIADSSKNEHRFFAVITDITELKKTENILREQEHELKNEKKNLEEANITLKVLLDHQGDEIKNVEQRLRNNLRTKVLPYIEKIKIQEPDENVSFYIGVIEKHLNNIIAEYSRNLGIQYIDLTSKEIQIADMIREGMSSKEIASFLNISTRTVEIHRTNIRKKLGLKGAKDSLQKYLQQSFEQ